MRPALIAGALLAASACTHAAAQVFAPGTAQSQEAAIVVSDLSVLRAAPRDGAQQQAQLWQGELLEVRGERLDYLQVYDHQRERAGFIRASQVRRTVMASTDAPALLGVVRFVRDTPGSEALGIGFAAAYLKAAPAATLRGPEGVEVFDALGTMADRLAHRASWGAQLSQPQQAQLAAHLEVATHYGIAFRNQEREGRMQICYEGEAFRRVLALDASPQQQARAALALTRPECLGELKPIERHAVDQWRTDVLDRVDAALLPGYLKNRVLMRRASVWSALAYQKARVGQGAAEAAQRAVSELAGVNKADLTDIDLPAFSDAAMRANASRWAAVAVAATTPTARPSIVTVPGQPGETCVLLVDAKNDATNPLAKRCTYALVWPQSATLNREGNALALAVQPLEAWRELWLFRKRGREWTISILPPATSSPEIGYAEFAGWVPGGKQLLVAREARGDGKYKRNYEVVSIDSLATARQSVDPAALGAFQRWQDSAWKRMTVSLR